MELEEIFLLLPSEQIAYVKFIFESYEEVGIIRTVDRRRAVIVLLVMPDFMAAARSILAALMQEVALVEIPRPAAIGDDWLMTELTEPAVGSS
jgi:hypothetical protein